MKTNENSQHIKRAYFGKMCTDKNLSVNTRLKLSEVIKKSRLNGGDKLAERTAEQLTELVKEAKTEQEILTAIKELD